MHGQSSWSSQVGLDKWQIFKVMKQGIGTSYFASSSIPWMADHGYNFMQPFYSSDSSRMIIFAPAICRTFMQFPSACAKIELSYFPKKVFPSHLSTGFSFLFTRESPLNRHWVGWFPGFSTSETHGGILSIFPLIQLWPLNGPSPWVFHWWLPKRQRNPCKSSHVRCGSSHFLNGKPWVFLIYVSLP